MTDRDRMDATGEGIQKAEESGNAEESGGKAAGEPRLSPLSSVPLLSSAYLHLSSLKVGIADTLNYRPAHRAGARIPGPAPDPPGRAEPTTPRSDQAATQVHRVGVRKQGLNHG